VSIDKCGHADEPLHAPLALAMMRVIDYYIVVGFFFFAAVTTWKMSMKLSDFDYYLPQELIAQEPAAVRDTSRLMVLDRKRRTVEHARFGDVTGLLVPGDLLVANDTRVIPARLYGKKETGGRVEVFLLSFFKAGDDGCPVWECLLKSRRKVALTSRLRFSPELEAVVLERTGSDTWLVRFSCAGDFNEILDRIGATPLPPYIRRQRGALPDAMDRERYQTVYAKTSGAVAAPTAGFHFTRGLMDAITARGAAFAYVTLHIGYGTFQPIREENIEEHVLHKEYFQVEADTVRQVTLALAERRRVIAVGTTATRVLETLTAPDGTMACGQGTTGLYIYPGYTFKAVSGMITNFHLPGSSLLLLVCAFAGREFMLEAYAEAVKQRYRFFSYGDAMLIL